MLLFSIILILVILVSGVVGFMMGMKGLVWYLDKKVRRNLTEQETEQLWILLQKTNQ